MNHIDLFCGCGGMGLGFNLADFELLFAVDSKKSACVSYGLNLGGTVYNKKIEELTLIPVGEVDVISGGFPCQPFSVAGLMKGFEDEKSVYYESMIKLFDFYKPKFIVLENVKNFVTHNKGKSIKRVVNDITNLGYVVKYKVLNAWDYDTPQKRERVFIVANRIGVDFEFPEPTNNRFVLRDFIEDIGEGEGFQFTPKKAYWFNMIPEGGDWRDLPTEEIKKEAMGKSYLSGGGKTGYYKRLSMDEPSLTLLTTVQSKMTPRAHPRLNRWLNVKEYAAIQTFPSNYLFYGSLSDKYEQIGNAVPVNLAYHIANQIKSHLI